MIEVRVLGEFTVMSRGRRVRPATRKESALLAYLVERGSRAVHRDRLTALLWRRSSRRRARHSLSQALYNLRRRIPALPLRREGEDIWIEIDDISADVLGFRTAVDEGRYREAVRLFNGEFLDGFWIEGAPDFDQWQDVTRSELNRMARSAFARALAEAEAEGRWDGVQRLADRVLRIDPFNEEVHRARILAVAASGDHARAVREADAARRFLVREAGDAAGAYLTDLAARLRELHRSAAGPPDADGSDGDDPLPFVGREREFRDIRGRWKRVKDGAGRSVAVLGEAGIGKTRFCRRFLRLAVLQGARIFRGRCHASGVRVPYSGIVDALLDGLRSDDLSQLPPAWVAVVTELLPELASVPSDPAPMARLEGEGARRRLFEAVARLLRAIAEATPIVLHIDDFQWADESTAAFVHYLAQRLDDRAALLLLALRPEDAADRSYIGRMLRGDRGHRGLDHLPLGELGTDATDRLMAAFEQRCGSDIPDPVRRQVYAQTGGRPFFVLEVLRAVADQDIDMQPDHAFPPERDPTLLPASVEEFLTGRIADLNGRSTQVLSGLAVAGREAPLRLVRRVSDLSRGEFLLGLRGLVRKGLVRDHGETVAFSHDLVREAAYRFLGDAQRRLLHEAVAAELRSSGSASPGTLAIHFDRAGVRRSAHRCAVLAADESDRVYAHDQTEFFLRMALDNTDGDKERLRVQHRLALLLYRVRRYSEANQLFEALEHRFRAGGDRSRLVEVAVQRVNIALRQGTAPATVLVNKLKALAVIAEEEESHSQLARVLRTLGVTAFDSGERGVLRSAISRMVDLGRLYSDSSFGVLTLSTAAQLTGVYIDLDTALRYSEEALRHARTLRDPTALVSVLTAFGSNRLQSGRFSEAERNLLEAIDISNDKSVALYDHFVLNNYGVLLMEKGDYEDARRVLNDAIDRSVRSEAWKEFTVACHNLSVLHLETGHLSEAEKVIHEVLASESGHLVWWSVPAAWSVLGLCALSDRRVHKAAECRDKMSQYAQDDHPSWVCDVSYIEIFLARFSSETGEHAQALDRLDRAIAAYEKLDVLCRSRLELERARLLIRTDPNEARRGAAAVRDRARRMGAKPLVEKAERILTRVSMYT